MTIRVPAGLAVKWSADVLDDGFVPFPKRLLRSMVKLFPGEQGVRNLAVVLAVADYRRDKAVRDPSVGVLAFNAGMTVEEFKEGLDDLKSKSLIDCWGPDTAVRIELGGLLTAIMRESSGEV